MGAGLKSSAEGVAYVADYGDNVDNFLECVPSYIHAVPALQVPLTIHSSHRSSWIFTNRRVHWLPHQSCDPYLLPSPTCIAQAANVEMLSWLSDLRTREGNTTGAALLQSLAHNLTEEMQTRMYRKGQGFWSCLYPNNTAMPVRHVIDFLYIARGLEAGGRGPGLGTQIRKEMGRFFRSELQGKTWLHALSPIDTLARTLPIDDAILRPDHGITGEWPICISMLLYTTLHLAWHVAIDPMSPFFLHPPPFPPLATGSYDAWAALCVEALGIVDGDWAHALQFLRDTSAVTRGGPYGQAHELPPDAPSAFKTKRGFTRFIADNGETDPLVGESEKSCVRRCLR